MIGRGAAIGDAGGGLLNAGKGGVGFDECFFECHANNLHRPRDLSNGFLGGS